MKIDLTMKHAGKNNLDEADLSRIAEEIFFKLGLNESQDTIEVFLVTDEEIAEINSKYRDKNSPTDVLSFPQVKMPNGSENTLGTIFIAPDYASKIPVEIEELFIHGVLHLLGYDHESNLNQWLEAEKKIERSTL